MKQEINKRMIDYNLSYKELAEILNISNHTLTRKINGSTDWTYAEIIILTKLLHIQDPQNFFFDGI